MSGKTVAASRRVLRALVGAVAGAAVLGGAGLGGAGLGGAAALAAERGAAFRPVFVAQNDHLVYPMQDGTFEVQARAGTAGPQYFCAAGDYAWRKLSVPVASRVVIVRPDGPSTTNPGGRGMVFKIVPQGGATAGEGYAVSTVGMRRVGENYSVAHSRALCRDAFGVFGWF